MVVVMSGPVQWPQVRGHAMYRSGTASHRSVTSAQAASSGVPVQSSSSSSSACITGGTDAFSVVVCGGAVVAVVAVVVVMDVADVLVTVFVVMLVLVVVLWHTPHINGQPLTTLGPRTGSKQDIAPMNPQAPRSTAPTHASACGIVVAATVVAVLVVAVLEVAVLVVAVVVVTVVFVTDVAVVVVNVVATAVGDSLVEPSQVSHKTKHMLRTILEYAGSMDLASSQSSLVKSRQPALSSNPLQVPTVDVEVLVLVEDAVVIVVVDVDVLVEVLVEVDEVVDVVVDVDVFVDVVVDVEVLVEVTVVTVVVSTHELHKTGHVLSSSARTAATGVVQKAAGTPQRPTGSGFPLHSVRDVSAVTAGFVVSVIVVSVAVVSVLVVTVVEA